MSSTVVATGNTTMPSPVNHHNDQSSTALPPNGFAKIVPSVSESKPVDSQVDGKSSPSPAPEKSDPNDSEGFSSTDSPTTGTPDSSVHSVSEPPSADQDTSATAPTSSESQDATLQRRKPGPAPQIQVRPGVTVCQNCLTTTTPLWRRDENGQIMCNACGLFLKLHGRRRPISLKTDVIKSRNRSNRQNRPGTGNVPQPKRRHIQTPMAVSTQPDGTKPAPASTQNSATHHSHAPRNSTHPQPQAQQPQPQPQAQQQLHISGHPGLPLGALPGIASMGGVPVVYPTSPALSPYLGSAAQGVLMNSPGLAPIAAPVISAHHLGHQPLSPQVIAHTNGGPIAVSQRHGRGAMSEQLLPRSPESTDRIPHLAQVPVAQFQKSHDESQSPSHQDKSSTLMTRVSELELVNDLLRRRIQDLESSEAEARKEVASLKEALSKAEQQSKRIKVSELV